MEILRPATDVVNRELFVGEARSKKTVLIVGTTDGFFDLLSNVFVV